MASYIKIMRELKDKSFYSKDSEKVHLWLHLLLSVNWKEKEELLGGKPILCKAGQFTTGRKQLSMQTGISESKIERILTYFEKIEQQIEQQKTNTNRLISILNWDKHQQTEQQTEQQVNNDRTTSEQQVNTLKEDKEFKQVKKKNNTIDFSRTPKKKYHEDVEFLYGLYPTTCPIKKSLTGKCSKNKDTLVVLLKTKKKEELEKSINYYLDDCKKANRYLKNFTTFLANIPDIEESESEPEILTIEHFNKEWRELFALNLRDDIYKERNRELRKKYKEVLEEYEKTKRRY